MNTEPNDTISIRGAKVHNLKNVSIDIPRNNLIVITGLSGSGKSSLAFDTLYAEGQRRYVESLSSYARQFLGRVTKPEVDSIAGIPPAIAIEQKVNTRNPRSTVGTSTEIYDYLKLLFARIGKTFSPISGKVVKRHTVSDVVDFINLQPKGTKIMLVSPLVNRKGEVQRGRIEELIREGLTRLEVNGEIIRIDAIKGVIPDSRILIDRFSVEHNEDFLSRVADSVQTAFGEGDGCCIVKVYNETQSYEEAFCNRFEADGIVFEEPTEHLFSFNSPLGACPKCEGYGKVIGIDEDLVIPNKSLSIYQDAIAPWKGETMSWYKDQVIKYADKYDFPIHRPYYQLSEKQKTTLWDGNKDFDGLHKFFKHLEEKKYKIQYRVMLSRYMGKTICPECKGGRLKEEASFVKVNGYTIQDLVNTPVSNLIDIIGKIKLDEHQTTVSKRLLRELSNRIGYLNNVGLGYLTLNRLSSTLSGGESQRINLSTSLGSSLVGSLYILDEPSIGLHPRDTHLLIDVLKDLRNLGNTVVVVEHDEEIMRASDIIIDIGPYAGRLGGEILYSGPVSEIDNTPSSLTARYLTGVQSIEIPIHRRVSSNYITIYGARENNLKNLTVKFPLNVMTIVTGVSGSGKSSLIRGILYPSLMKAINGSGERPGQFDNIDGDIHLIKGVEMVDQNPIGKSSRSNPVTYIKAWDEIRKLFSDQPYAKRSGYKPSHFSFNVEGGRCEECQGEGIITVEMQFMADVVLVCENCNGKRFKEDVLDVKYKGMNVFDVLEMTVDQAMEFFKDGVTSTEKKIVDRLKPLQDVGLGYIKLGQSSSTLSGGESQRVKLASYLQKDQAIHPHMFIFDEPTTGLHFHDIHKLLKAFDSLINRGHSLVVIEHNLDVIKCADWIVDLGPTGGDQGGYLVFEGTPEDMINCKASTTGRFLRSKLTRNKKSR